MSFRCRMPSRHIVIVFLTQILCILLYPLVIPVLYRETCRSATPRTSHLIVQESPQQDPSVHLRDGTSQAVLASYTANEGHGRFDEARISGPGTTLYRIDLYIQ